MRKPPRNKKNQSKDEFKICCLPRVPDRPLEAGIAPGREALIRYHEKKWANQTVLHYHFLSKPSHWRGAAKQKAAVRKAFKHWKNLGIGLEFAEVQNAEEAEIRIGFYQGDGAWSYVGRDSLKYAPDPKERTMNFGWDLTTPYGWDTALHEIGHALGSPHEHQNPNAGIVWDEDKVYEYFSGEPNNWDRDKIFYNIIRKITQNQVEGSDWDSNSIMHYSFDKGLILNPAKYQSTPLRPAPGLSNVDIARIRIFYPPVNKKKKLPELRPFESRPVSIGVGEQLDFVVKPTYSRVYSMQTFGAMDTVMVLFEEINGEPHFLSGDDDSGFALNSKIDYRLMRGRTYFVRLRLYYNESSGDGAILLS